MNWRTAVFYVPAKAATFAKLAFTGGILQWCQPSISRSVSPSARVVGRVEPVPVSPTYFQRVILLVAGNLNMPAVGVNFEVARSAPEIELRISKLEISVTFTNIHPITNGRRVITASTDPWCSRRWTRWGSTVFEKGSLSLMTNTVSCNQSMGL